MDAEWAGSIGETKEEKMEQGEFEALATTLPTDLAKFVVEDNNTFQEEIAQWDRDQQAQKLQEMMAASQPQPQPQPSQQEMDQTVSSAVGTEPSDLQVRMHNRERFCVDPYPSFELKVVEEKLTYVNNHAKLSLEVTMKAFNAVEKIVKEKSAQTGVLTALEKVIEHYCTTHKDRNATSMGGGVENGPPKTDLLPKQDCRLESFVYYLLRNDETNNMPLVELAVLEEFSFPGLENNSQTMSAFRGAADTLLKQRRAKHPHEAASLRQWHQVYHLFRRSVHCFISGLEAQMATKYNQALELYTEAHNFTTFGASISVSVSFMPLNCLE